MATALRRCLYIGLGGTGMNALLHTKKIFMETYGEVPPMIGFLGLDTDGGVYTKTVKSKCGDIGLIPSEQLSISSSEALSIYKRNPERFSWIPSDNVSSIVGMTIGAGQIRTNGRLAFTINYNKIEGAVKTALNNIKSPFVSGDKEYSLIDISTEIHLVFSIGGGTGCGTFLNMAYLLRKVAADSKIIAYPVLSDVFEAMVPSGPAMARVKPNAYGAIQDLDWFMHLTPGSHPFSFEYFHTRNECTERPFNAVMFVDNKNANNDVYNHVNQLTEMLSLALVTSAGQLSVAAASVSDNVEKFYMDGSMDIDNKKAWASGLGVCQVIFKGEEIAEIYKTKASIRLIQMLLSSCKDIDVIVNGWIDSPNVNIRENNGSDNVINYLLKAEPKYPLGSIEDADQAKGEVEAYLHNVKADEDAVAIKVQSLSTKVERELKNLIIEHINKECGVENCLNIIMGIQSQIDIFYAEMDSEEKKLNEDIVKKQVSIDSICSSLSDTNGKFMLFGKGTKLNEDKESLCQAAMSLAICRNEIVRRKHAKTFFIGIKNVLEKHYTELNTFKKTFAKLNQLLTHHLSAVQNMVGKTTMSFEIDLFSELSNMVVVNDKLISVEQFANKINNGNQLYDLINKDADEIAKYMDVYIATLPDVKAWCDKSVDDVFDTMSDEKFTRIMNKAISKATPLFKENYHGYVPATDMYKGYLVGVHNKNKSRLVRDNAFKNMQQDNTNIDFVEIGAKDRIIIYRQLGVVPAFAVANIHEYKEKYDKCNVFTHIDSNLYTRMERENYSLTPTAKIDDTMELWIQGNIFGLIKNDEKGYFYKNSQDGDPLDDYWVDLNTVYRDEAFENFKLAKNQIRNEFAEYFQSEIRRSGTEQMKLMEDSVKTDYFTNHSNINMDKSEIKNRGNEKIAELMRKELAYIKNNFK